MNTRFTLKGSKQVTSNLRKAAINTPFLLAYAAAEEFEIERQEVMKRTPVDTRQLQNSFELIQEWHGRTLIMHILTNVEYAPYVHEDLDAFHPVGQAKFLESVLNESAPYMARRIGARLKGLRGLLA